MATTVRTKKEIIDMLKNLDDDTEIHFALSEELCTNFGVITNINIYDNRAVCGDVEFILRLKQGTRTLTPEKKHKRISHE